MCLQQPGTPRIKRFLLPAVKFLKSHHQQQYRPQPTTLLPEWPFPWSIHNNMFSTLFVAPALPKMFTDFHFLWFGPCQTTFIGRLGRAISGPIWNIEQCFGMPPRESVDRLGGNFVISSRVSRRCLTVATSLFSTKMGNEIVEVNVLLSKRISLCAWIQQSSAEKVPFHYDFAAYQNTKLSPKRRRVQSLQLYPKTNPRTCVFGAINVLLMKGKHRFHRATQAIDRSLRYTFPSPARVWYV